ncbi:MAG: hypothetical protein WC663_03270 [Patescibacteria group bacterium]|jgi:hypothetical protein
MALIESIKNIVTKLPAELKEKNGKYEFELTIAERKVFLSSKKLVYKAKFKIDDAKKELIFSEMLKESGFGLSSGSDDQAPGFGFKAGTYKTGLGPRTGKIEEQSELFKKKYNYKFDFSKIRNEFEKAVQNSGYNFKYQIFSV